MYSLKARIVLVVAVLAAVAGAGWASWVIFGKSPPHASAEALACRKKPRELNNLQPAATSGPLPGVALLEDGKREVTLAQYGARGIVLNFWATWCAPCIKELPSLARLAKESDGPESSFIVLPISEDREGAPIVRKFLEINKLDELPVLIDPKGALARAFKVGGLPTTILIDRNGREIGRLVGIAEWDRPAVRRFLEDCLTVKAKPTNR